VDGASDGDVAARAAGLARMAGVAEGREPIVLPTRRVDVSSTEIRARVRAGLTIRGFVPDGVAEYIARAGLYR
jgi:nicotinate-nucleotide adenylyltransferase